MPTAVVATVLGTLGIAWNERGLTRVLLPLVRDGDDDEDAMTRALRRLDRVGALDAIGSGWAERLAAHLSGEPVHYDDLRIDASAVTPFARRVYDAARAIPRGTTITYAELARAVGTGAARAVGVALGRNPTPIVVPCHRIVASDGAGGFSAPGGASTKAQLLAIEGGSLDDETHRAARRHLARVDPELAKLVRAIPCTLPVRPNGNLFRTIVRAITGQQLSTKAAATIFARLEAALAIGGDARWQGQGGARWPDDAPSRVLGADEAALRAVGLSAAKAASIRDLAQRVSSGALDLVRIVRAPDERVVDALTAVRGIGRWTAEMLLIFDLGRPDVLPVDDLGVRKGLQKVHGLRALPDAETVTRRAEAWRPFRSIGSWYLWRALDATPT
ncbi:MAG: methylated-DNA--[protein]-cysteine S-methyltransferase [Deltaproteobacteria bacterium]|nr:methylated-DNA--[protein]-cysteine S-methyltransferase [Deltaproteobacteria bacterium]